MTAVTDYLASIGAALAKGDATEHTHRPALKAFVESCGKKIVATNEPKRIACGAPDFAVSIADLTVGYIEAKDVGVPLAEALKSDQLKRYIKSLDNLLLTDYLEFRWFTDGEQRLTARLADVQAKGKLSKTKDGEADLEKLMAGFLDRKLQSINSPRELAERMARLTHVIRDIIIAAFETDQASEWLRDWRKAFKEVLIADLDQPQRTSDFADMFAQTLSYGLFTARVMDDTQKDFSRAEAQRLIPRSNPFLRNFFMDISTPRVDEEPFSSFVNDLVNLLGHTNMGAVLADFGRRTRQEDPVVHFYETFLAAYDPQLRESRGVYYTPEPVVSYIVRSVDEVLKRDFGCPKGLADQTEITVKNLDPSLRVRGKKDEVRKTTQSHKVLVLDPAIGTGTFLYGVIDHIRQQFIDSNNAGMWRGYVHKHLLPRLFGFEFMVAPYAVAHFKLSLQLMAHDLPPAIRAQWAYQPQEGERIGVYLTNTLDEAHPETPMPLFTQYVADESNAADEVKLHRPVLVVMGNPPYSGHSSNRGKWMDDLQHGLVDGVGVPSYYQVDGAPLGEKNPKWLKNDYVKFLCFGQWRIARNGEGILAFITDHGYLDNPTFRGMRQSLLNTFSEIYILDLHGGSKKKEKTPQGGVDQNVFDIQQGVSIAIFIKRKGSTGAAVVRHADLWGMRPDKYEWLQQHTLTTTTWSTLTPQSPFYLFRPQDAQWLESYQKGWKLTDIFPVNVLGFQTHRDHFAVDFDRATVEQRATDLRDAKLSDEAVRDRYGVKDNRDWQLASARAALKVDADWRSKIIECSYRPFDDRYCYFSGAFMDYPRRELLDHVAGRDNLCLLASRQQGTVGFRHAWIAKNPPNDCVVSTTSREANQAFPLYLYPSTTNKTLPLGDDAWPADAAHNNRTLNLKPEFIAALSTALRLQFIAVPTGTLQACEFGPEDVLGYIYAILHCPTYRVQFAEYLRMDFARIPITSDVAQFRQLVTIGKELVELHILNSAAPATLSLRFPLAGSNEVARRHPRYTEPTADASGRVYINADQFIEGVPEDVWEFRVGGFQVAHKWLNERVGRSLNFDDLTHYQNVLQAIARTIELMADVDDAVPSWPIT